MVISRIKSLFREIRLYNRLLKKQGYAQINRHFVLVHVPPYKIKPYKYMLMFNIMLMFTLFAALMEQIIDSFWIGSLLLFLGSFSLYCLLVIKRQSLLVIRPLTRYWRTSIGNPEEPIAEVEM